MAQGRAEARRPRLSFRGGFAEGSLNDNSRASCLSLWEIICHSVVIGLEVGLHRVIKDHKV